MTDGQLPGRDVQGKTCGKGAELSRCTILLTLVFSNWKLHRRDGFSTWNPSRGDQPLRGLPLLKDKFILVNTFAEVGGGGVGGTLKGATSALNSSSLHSGLFVMWATSSPRDVKKEWVTQPVFTFPFYSPSRSLFYYQPPHSPPHTSSAIHFQRYLLYFKPYLSESFQEMSSEIEVLLLSWCEKDPRDMNISPNH
jgi:hypothetical protein